MTTNIAMGLDIAKGSAVFELLLPDDTRPARGTLKPTREALRGLVATLATLRFAPKDCPVCMESTGDYGVHWADALLAEGFPVFVLNPLVSKSVKSVENAVRGKKSDPADAHSLAEAVLVHEARLKRFAHTKPQADTVVLRKFARLRHGLREALTATLKSCGTTLHLAFPEACALKLRLTTRKVRRLLLRAPSAPEIAALREGTIADILGDRDEAKAVREAAKNTFADPGVARAAGIALLSGVRLIETLTDELDRVTADCEKALAAMPRSRVAEKLRTLAGIGEITAPTLAAYLPEDFLSRGSGRRKVARKLGAHFGIEPRAKDSGDKKGRGRMSKRGSPIARLALSQAAWGAVQYDPGMNAYYKAMLATGKSHGRAMVDVMRKLVGRIVDLFWDDRPPPPEKCTPPV